MKELQAYRDKIHSFTTKEYRDDVHNQRKITRRVSMSWVETEGKGKITLEQWKEGIREASKKIGEEDILDKMIEFTFHTFRHMIQTESTKESTLKRAYSLYVGRYFEKEEWISNLEFKEFYLNKRNENKEVEIIEVDTKIDDGFGKKIDVKQACFDIKEEEKEPKEYENGDEIIRLICGKIKSNWGKGSELKFIINNVDDKLRIDLDVGIEGTFINIIENAFDEELNNTEKNRKFLWEQCQKFRKVAVRCNTKTHVAICEGLVITID